MKKIYLVLLSMLAIFALVSCQKKEETVSIADAEITVQVEKEWLPYYEAAIKRVNEKYPDAKINIKEAESFKHLELIDATGADNEEVTDVFAYPLDRFDGLESKDVLAVINAKKIADNIKAPEILNEGISKQLQKDNEFLGFPFNIETLIAAINTKNAEKQGIILGEKIELTELGDLQFLVPMFNAWWGVAITNAFDVELLEKDGDNFRSTLVKDFSELTPEQQKMFEGMYAYWQMSNKNRSELFDISSVYGYVDKEFSNDMPGVVRIVGPWEVPGITSLIGDNLEVRDLSSLTFAGKELRHWQGGWALGVNARCEENPAKLALAEELISELLNTKYAADLYKYAGKIMPQATADDYNNSDLNDVDKKVIAAVINSYKSSVSRPIFKEWGGVWDTWQNALVSWNSQKPKSVEEAYKLVQESFKALMTNVK